MFWNESGNGDLSNSQSAPNPFTLGSGANSVVGTVDGTTDSQDWIALTIPSGFQLSSIILQTYSSADSQGFTGFQSGSSFVGNPETTASAYSGFTHFGTGAQNGALAPVNLVGADLLPIMADPANAPGAQGFTPPLGAGTYSFLIQQLGGSTSYQFDYGVTPVPEPATEGVIAGIVCAGFFLKRRFFGKQALAH
ncbi:MAG TPA: hypothetical protein VGR78_05225 [Verrucomicrobiae bacterium]|nr:hypothetical protein [Verrucomicrobiae bacterium]